MAKNNEKTASRMSIIGSMLSRPNGASLDELVRKLAEVHPKTAEGTKYEDGAVRSYCASVISNMSNGRTLTRLMEGKRIIKTDDRYRVAPKRSAKAAPAKA